MIGDPITIQLPNGTVTSGWCDKDDPNRMDCGDYLTVDVAGRQAFYAETADLAAYDATKLRREINCFFNCLKRASATNKLLEPVYEIPVPNPIAKILKQLAFFTFIGLGVFFIGTLTADALFNRGLWAMMMKIVGWFSSSFICAVTWLVCDLWSISDGSELAESDR